MARSMGESGIEMLQIIKEAAKRWGESQENGISQVYGGNSVQFSTNNDSVGNESMIDLQFSN
jgi:hypothetical protein